MNKNRLEEMIRDGVCVVVPAQSRTVEPPGRNRSYSPGLGYGRHGDGLTPNERWYREWIAGQARLYP